MGSHSPNTTNEESAPQKQVVLLIHGIRTQASWAEMVGAVLEKDPNVKVVPVRYGYFDTIRFLSPFWTRKRVIKRIVREIRDVRQRNPGADISAIAHSFGTYALLRALEEPDIELHKIIICGSIVPEDFRVSRYRAQIGFSPILNDCGTHDIWPLIAKASTWGYGSSGTFGFGTAGIHDRFNKFSHSSYFSKDFVEKYWLPFISDGEILSTEWEEGRSTVPVWQSLLAILPLRWVLALIVLVGVWFLYDITENAKPVGVAFATELYAGHIVGATEIGTSLVFENERLEASTFANFSANLVSPSGDISFLQHVGMRANGMPVPPLQQIYVESDQFLRFDFTFRDDYTEQAVALQKAYKYLEDNPANLVRWDSQSNIFSQEIVDELTALANEEFSWTPGKWSYEVTFLFEGKPHTINTSFIIREADINRMKASIAYYNTGLGVLPIWVYFSPDGTTVMQRISLEN